MIFEENKSAQWLGADTINYQKAILAVQTIQKKYCTPVPPSTPFSKDQAEPSTSPSSQPPPKKKTKQQPDPMVAQLTSSKNPHKVEAPNHFCEVLYLPGPKDQRLQDFIEAELNMFMTKVS